MMTSLAHLATCRWSARRLERYLDEDPSAPLSAHDEQRLEHHLSVCARCAATVDDLRRVKAALARFDARRGMDDAALARLDDLAARLSTGGPA